MYFMHSSKVALHEPRHNVGFGGFCSLNVGDSEYLCIQYTINYIQ